MTYVKQTWVNGPAGLTPISAARLNHLEDGIDGGHDHQNIVFISESIITGVPATDRVLIQAILDSAGDGTKIQFPAMTITLDRDSTGFYCLRPHGNQVIDLLTAGGTTLKLADGQHESTRMFWNSGTASAGTDNLTILGGTIDGNKANNTVSEQRHGLFLEYATNCKVIGTKFINWTGDGITLYREVSDFHLHRSVIKDCNRNGITLYGPNVDRIWITKNHINVAIQPIDWEGPTTSLSRHVYILGNFLQGNDTNFGMTCGGGSAATQSSEWVVDGNILVGCSINVVWLRDSIFSDNVIYNGAGTYSGIRIQNFSTGITVDNNYVRSGNVDGAIYVFGTTDAERPHDITLSNNRVAPLATHGIRCQGVNGLQVVDNRVKGDGLGSGKRGIYILNTFDMPSTKVAGNTVRNINATGIYIATSGANNYRVLAVTDNVVDDTGATLLTGIWLAGIAAQFLRVRLAGNLMGSSVTTPYDVVSGIPSLTGGDYRPTVSTVHPVIATASLPAAAAAQDGRIVIEDNGAGDRNLIIYAGGQRFRIDGGAAF